MLELLEVSQREAVLGGQPFGHAGSYEMLSGRATFAVDPSDPANAPVVDLALAPQGADGMVRCSADWFLLRPVDPVRGNGVLLYDVVNRGNKTALASLQSAPRNNHPGSAEDFGNGFLMRRGVTLAAVGWQVDLQPGLGRMLLDAPVATHGGLPITGPVRMTLIPDRAVASLPLVRPDHRCYPPIEDDQADAELVVRDSPDGEPRSIPRERWAFAAVDGSGRRPSANDVWLEGGFEPGRIYEVIYTGAEPLVAGLGFTATRDYVGFLRYAAADARGNANPLFADGRSSIGHAIGYGASQSGRFLRQFVYEGFNRDEQGRSVFDGMFVYIAAAGMGSFNHRFAQPSRTRPHANGIYPIELYPFADDPVPDPLTGRNEGLLDRARADGTVPRIMYVNSSAEYWGGGASLLHTDPLGATDVEPPEEVRIYHIAGAQHVAGPWPPQEAGYMPLLPYPTGRHPLSPVMVQPALRALELALEQWVQNGTPPPPSAYPRIADGTLQSHERVVAAFPAIPGAKLPREIGVPHVLDYGPRWSEGIIDREPPGLGRAYGPLVPSVNEDGNEPAGVQLAELRAPIATYTGWNLRHPDTGRPDAMVVMLGAYLPFPATPEATAAGGDPRTAISTRYRDGEAYLARIEEAIVDLITARLLLAEDAPAIRERAVAQWEAHAAPVASEATPA